MKANTALTINTDIERKHFEGYILIDRGPGYLLQYWNNEDKRHDYIETHIQEAWEAWIARAAIGQFSREGALNGIV